MKILFIGCVESSYRLLKKLIAMDAEIVGVITKQKSDFNADFSDLRPLCEECGIPYLYDTGNNDTKQTAFVKKWKPDIGYCFGWSKLLKQDFIGLFPEGIVGYHPAELPLNRGRHPIIWALALGLEQTASTFFMLSAEADTGDIVSQQIVSIDYTDHAGSLYDKLMCTAEMQVEQLWEAFENRCVERVPQEILKGNVWRKRTREDGRIDWRMSSRAIYNLVRALTRPYAGAHFIYKGRDVKVWRVEEIRVCGYENIEPGKVLQVNANGRIDVKVSDSIIRIMEADECAVTCGEYL